MNLEGYIITGVKVINIIEENATAIEKMTNKAIEDIRAEVGGNYTELVDGAVTIVGFEDIDNEFETYYIDETDISSYDNNYFANNVLVTVNKGPQNNEQEHR